MKYIPVFLLLGSCSTAQIADTPFSCGGTASFEIEYFEPGQVKRIFICSGTEGNKNASYELFGKNGNVIKRINITGSDIRTTEAIKAVGVTLRSAGSNDAKTREAALGALPKLLEMLRKVP